MNPIEEFKKERSDAQKAIAKDQALREKSLEWMLHADKYNYIYNLICCRYINGRFKGMGF
jgi:hypothetical protein